MELPAPCERPLEHLGRAAEGPPAGRGWRGGGRAGSPAYLLVQGDVVQPHAHLPGEEVAAVVTVPQEAPAERRAGQRVEGVSRATQAQSRAGCSQTLGAGVVVVQEAWLGRTQSPYRGARGARCQPLADPQDPKRPAHPPCKVMDTLSKSWWSGSFHVSKFHLETCSRPYLPAEGPHCGKRAPPLGRCHQLMEPSREGQPWLGGLDVMGWSGFPGAGPPCPVPRPSGGPVLVTS